MLTALIFNVKVWSRKEIAYFLSNVFVRISLIFRRQYGITEIPIVTWLWENFKILSMHKSGPRIWNSGFPDQEFLQKLTHGKKMDKTNSHDKDETTWKFHQFVCHLLFIAVSTIHFLFIINSNTFKWNLCSVHINLLCILKLLFVSHSIKCSSQNISTRKLLFNVFHSVDSEN